ncbi:hypothetical protein [Spirosoma telluris]
MSARAAWLKSLSDKAKNDKMSVSVLIAETNGFERGSPWRLR